MNEPVFKCAWVKSDYASLQKISNSDYADHLLSLFIVSDFGHHQSSVTLDCPSVQRLVDELTTLLNTGNFMQPMPSFEAVLDDGSTLILFAPDISAALQQVAHKKVLSISQRLKD